MSNPVILTFVAHYLPGYKSGGPLRTIANMVDQLGDEFTFRIVTQDRDALDTSPYPGVMADQWNRVGKAEVLYLSPERLRLFEIARLLSDTCHDVLYLNSFFEPQFTVLPLLARKLGLAPRRPCVIAPRGEFSDGAIALKAWKKRPFLTVASIIGLYRELIWQASSEYEKADIETKIGGIASQIYVASDLPATMPPDLPDSATSQLYNAALRVVFLSRITPMKNLTFALRVLAKIRVPVEFNIYGPVRDELYWNACQDLISTLPKHVQATYKGSIPPESVCRILAEHDLFFLPTLGENYGHVIAEALSSGTPVLIADTTPWRNLERDGIGWDLSLSNNEEAFLEKIEYVAKMPIQERQKWRREIALFTRNQLSAPHLIEANRLLFMRALNHGFD